MGAPPWESDPAVDDYEHGGFNQQATASEPAAPLAAPKAADGPWANDPADTGAAPFSADHAAPLVDSSHLEGRFGDDPKPREVSKRMAPADEAQLLHILQTGTADDARRFAASKGFGGHDNFDAVIAARDKGGGVDKNLVYHLPPAPPSGAAAAGIRGVADDIPFNTKFASAIDALGLSGQDRPTVWDKDSKGFADAYHHNLDLNNGILDADEANHPHAQLAGQLLGGLLIPSGLEGVGFKAGQAALRAGATMREARAVAAAAVRNRVAVEGGAYGGLHGAGKADGGVGDMAAHALVGAAEGVAGGYGLTAAGQAVGKVAPAVAQALGRGAEDAGLATEGAPDYAQIARDLNIQRTPATTSKMGVSTVLQSGLGALPGGAPIQAGTSKEIGGLADAARGVADEVGTVGTPQTAGEAVSQGALAYKRASKIAGSALYKERDALIGGRDAPVPTDQAKAAIANIASRFPTSPEIAELRQHPALRAIEGALPGEATTEEVPTGLLDPEGKPITRTVTSGGEPLTLGETTEALSHVRSVSRRLARSGADDATLSRVNQVRDALAADVQTAAQRADEAAGRPLGPGSAVQADRDATRFWRDRAIALNGALKAPLASAADPTKTSGEVVYNQILGNMDRDTGNLAKLRDQWFRLPVGARRTFAATAIDDLGRASHGQQNDAGDAWSFNTFLTNRDKLSPQARNIVFGADADKKLDQIAAYASRLKDLDRSRNFSNTAQKYFVGAFMATVGGAVMKGDMGAAVEAAAAFPAAWGGAKLLLATPKMRDWTLSAMRAAQSPNSETGLRALTQRLTSIAAAEPTIADQVLGLQQHILKAVNDNFGHSVAASEPDKKKRADNR